MKLNFECCKICDCGVKIFKNRKKGFSFGCTICYFFVFEVKKYNSEKFDHTIYLETITEEEWYDIKKMEIIDFENYYFNECPYLLEHLVEQ